MRGQEGGGLREGCVGVCWVVVLSWVRIFGIAIRFWVVDILCGIFTLGMTYLGWQFEPGCVGDMLGGNFKEG